MPVISEEEFQAQQTAKLRQRFDANETAFLERELTQVRTRIFEKIYAPTVARSFVPKATDVAPSASTYTFKVWTPVGEAKLISPKGNDIPRVDVTATELTGKVRMLGCSYGWDIMEQREGARIGQPLSDIKARIASETVERAIDEMLALGSLPDSLGAYPDVGCTGLINNPVVDDSILSGTFWLGATAPDPDVVLAELSSLISTPADNSKGRFTANTLLMPEKFYSYAERTPFSALTGESILSTFRKNHPGVTLIAPWWRLTGAGAAGKHRFIAYQRDPMTAEAVIPQEMEVMPPEWQGFELVYNCFARCGGVKIYQPLAFKYMDAATS